MRRGLLTIACLVLFFWNTAIAQDQSDQAKYELIRETINFLASDKVVSQDTNFRITCETLDYDCFNQQLSSKPIAGIERWYNSWRAMAAADEAGLAALQDQIFADIFDRPGKGYRKQLVGYDGYISLTESLIKQDGAEAPMETAVDTDTVSEPLLTEPLLSPSELQRTDPGELTNDNPEKEDTMIAYIAIAIGIIALIIAALPILKKKEQGRPADLEGIEELQVRLDGLALRMQRFEQKITDAQMAEAIANLTQIMESVEERVVELENRG